MVEKFVLLSDPLSPTHHTDPTHHVLLAGPDRGAEVDLVVGAVTGGAAVADAGLGAELLQHRRHAGVVCGAALGGGSQAVSHLELWSSNWLFCGLPLGCRARNRPGPGPGPGTAGGNIRSQTGWRRARSNACIAAITTVRF